MLNYLLRLAEFYYLDPHLWRIFNPNMNLAWKVAFIEVYLSSSEILGNQCKQMWQFGKLSPVGHKDSRFPWQVLVFASGGWFVMLLNLHKNIIYEKLYVVTVVHFI